MLPTHSDGQCRRRGVVALVALTATIALSSAVGARAEDPVDPTTVPADTTPPPTPEATPPAGTYSTPQSVSLVSEPDAVIHYTTDGSDPTTASPTYGEPIAVSSSQTIKALAVDPAGNQSAVASHAYTIVPPYRDAVLAGQGLVSYWRFEETAGTTAADAKSTNPGSYRNGVLLGQPSGLPSDAGGKSIKLDGVNDYVYVPDRASLDTGDVFTLEAWVRRTSTSTARQTIFAKGSRSYLLHFDSNRLKLARAGSGDVASATVTTTDTAGFHHVVATKSGPTVKLYIDGVDRTGTVTNRTISNTSTALNIGRDTDGRRYFPGYVDEAAVYNRALTAAEVIKHYEAGIASGAGDPAPDPEPPPPSPPPHTKLAFSDDFEGSAGAAPDSTKWVAMNWCDRWGSLSCNTNRPQNVALDGAGNLRVRAIRENYTDPYGNTGTWTTGRLETQSKFSFTYGTVKGRIKVPAGRGLWPSFWTTSWNKTGWPATGEIDVMEFLGHEPEVSYCSVHGANSSGQHVTTTISYRSPVSLAADFHVYEARWDPGQVDFFVDGQRCGTISTVDMKTFSPQQVLVGMAVGGSWPGSPDATTPSPAEMLVDWVRVYVP
jgi:beta-glucanase (GH16 family)